MGDEYSAPRSHSQAPSGFMKTHDESMDFMDQVTVLYSGSYGAYFLTLMTTGGIPFTIAMIC